MSLPYQPPRTPLEALENDRHLATHGVGTPGASAYELWLAAGNVGTEADFLASLIGPMGPAGPADGPDLHYTHIQGSPSDEWVIVHNLGKYPAIDFIDTAGTTIYGEIVHDSLNQARGLFLAPFIGKAIAN